MLASLRSNASVKSKSERTQTGTQDLPTSPTIQQMKTWESEKVLRWIQQRDLSILVGDDLDTFNKLNFSGMAFLRTDFRFFHKVCHLFPVASLRLKRLVDQVKNGNQSNQTTRKRKGDETHAPEEAPISLKRHRLEDTLSDLAARARERRKHIREIITDLDDSVNKLSDPVFEATLPFPFVGVTVPNRFKVANGNWQYVGRTRFKELLQKVEDVRVSEVYTTTWLYGTPGYGKSHLLAALVCYLAAQDVRVVYIPDCRELVDEFIEYVRAAMLFAWADDITAQEEIMALKTEADIRLFFKEERNVTHNTVISSSANYTEYLEQSIEQSSNDVLRVYGGLDKREMDQWWNRHQNVDMGGYDRDRVQDITGGIPLLLDKCVVDGKVDLTVADLLDVYDNAVAFVQRASEATEGNSDWTWYCDFMEACFCHCPVPTGWFGHLDLVDHRYFYRDNSERCGGYTCGLVRDAVAEQLLLEHAVDTNFLFSLDRFIGNPSVVEFIIKHAVLSSIRTHGLAIGAGMKKSMVLRHLEPHPEFNATDKPVLYRPDTFNFKAIDGIIIFIKPEENEMETETNEKAKEGKKLLMFPIQITMAPASHSDSRQKFFQAYGKWITDISRFDVELEFLWITPEWCDSREYPASEEPPWPAHKERYIPIKKVNSEIWEKYERVKKDGNHPGC